MDFKKVRIKRIKKRMDELGMTARELGKRADVSESGISRILSGESDPRVSTFKKLASALRVDPVWLMGYGEDGQGESAPAETPIDIINYIEKYLNIPPEYFRLPPKDKEVIDHLIVEVVKRLEDTDHADT